MQKFKIAINATSEDGKTISQNIDVELNCEGNTALSVLVKFFEENKNLKNLFREAIYIHDLEKFKFEEKTSDDEAEKADEVKGTVL